MALNLHANTVANGNGVELFSTNDSANTTATIAAWGGFGAGTLAVKMSPDAGTTWLDFPTPITFTVAGTKQVPIPQGVKVRGELTGATGPTLFCSIFGAD
jgi:hypothetical protein